MKGVQAALQYRLRACYYGQKLLLNVCNSFNLGWKKEKYLRYFSASTLTDVQRAVCQIVVSLAELTCQLSPLILSCSSWTVYCLLCAFTYGPLSKSIDRQVQCMSWGIPWKYVYGLHLQTCHFLRPTFMLDMEFVEYREGQHRVSSHLILR